VAGLFLTFFGGYCIIARYDVIKISYVIYGIILIAFAILFGFIFIDKKKLRIIYLAIILAGGIAINSYLVFMQSVSGQYEMELTKENWYLSNCHFTNIDAEINDDVLVIKYFRRNASGDLTLVNEKDETKQYSVSFENGQIVVREVQ